MGVDIHMYIVEDGKILHEDIYDGRNSEWFNNLQGDGYDTEYEHLSREYQISEQAPEDLKEKANKDYYFGHRTIKVYDFLNWFETYRPDRHAGWATTYDKWAIENKGYIPDYLPHYLNKDDVLEDMCFVEYVDPYDSSSWLYDFLRENNVPFSADITFWFDC